MAAEVPRRTKIVATIGPACASPDVLRSLIDAGRYVAEGRDIGTVVSPRAPLKLFLTASDVARALPQPLLQLAVWAVAALLSLAGALTIAELGAVRLPRLVGGGGLVHARQHDRRRRPRGRPSVGAGRPQAVGERAEA